MTTPVEGGGVQGGEPTGESTPGQNPAWNDVLSVLPEQFHSVVTPHFQQWDQAAQSRIEQANSQLSQFEPYKQFAEYGVKPEDLEHGLQILMSINEDPRKVYDALASTYSFNDPSAGGDVDDDEDDSTSSQQNLQDPRFDQLQQGIELVSQIVLQEQQAKQQAKEDSALETELAALKTKFGADLDESFVLSHMQNGATGEQAAQAFVDFKNSLLQNNPRPFAPNVIGNSGGGAGLPSQAVDPTKLSQKDTRNLVAQILEAEFGKRS